ncbi:uncharacterized protein LOC112193453 [Rosa chinensis]|uniref:uncharacterized protein LOC112193453 n=1 Tax=Rosa chinensis TaxID=74649 RepID=UPI000D08F4B9|nr:uncharacterized protein LOC112193453 [Rosa chinensis]
MIICKNIYFFTNTHKVPKKVVFSLEKPRFDLLIISFMPSPTARPWDVVVGRATEVWLSSGGSSWNSGGHYRGCTLTVARFPIPALSMLLGNVCERDKQRRGGGMPVGRRDLTHLWASTKGDLGLAGWAVWTAGVRSVLIADRFGGGWSVSVVLGHLRSAFGWSSDVEFWQPGSGSDGDVGRGATVRAFPAMADCVQASSWALWYLGLKLLFRPIYFAFSFMLIICFLVLSGFMLIIMSYSRFVGRGGRCPGLCTLSAVSGLGRWQASCIVKWLQPPSGRMKPSVTEFIFRWQHSGKVGIISLLWLRVSIIFPVCRQNCKANGVANCALFASWCVIEYTLLVETSDIISECSLKASYYLGFRLYVPPLYSMVSLMVMA